MKITPIDQGQEAWVAPDLVASVDGATFDFAIVPTGLSAAAGLVTSIAICLFSDCAVDPSELPDGVENRGWPGDAIALTPGETVTPLGSKLWLLRRRALTDAILRQAEIWARLALQPLIDQRVAVSATVKASRDGSRRLDLDIALYGRDGALIYAGRFGLLWEQIR